MFSQSMADSFWYARYVASINKICDTACRKMC